MTSFFILGYLFTFLISFIRKYKYLIETLKSFSFKKNNLNFSIITFLNSLVNRSFITQLPILLSNFVFGPLGSALMKILIQLTLPIVMLLEVYTNYTIKKIYFLSNNLIKKHFYGYLLKKERIYSFFLILIYIALILPILSYFNLFNEYLKQKNFYYLFYILSTAQLINFIVGPVKLLSVILNKEFISIKVQIIGFLIFLLILILFYESINMEFFVLLFSLCIVFINLFLFQIINKSFK